MSADDLDCHQADTSANSQSAMAFHYYQSEVHQLDTFYVISATANDAIFHYLQTAALPVSSRYLIVQPQSRLQTLSAQVRACGVEHLEELSNDFDFMAYATRERVEYRHGLSTLASSNTIRAFTALTEQTIRRLLWEIRARTFSSFFYQQQLKNVFENRVPAKYLTGIAAGQTGILLAAGPSLDAILPWVSAHRSQLWVVAVSRLAQKLLKHNIIPDIIVAVDPTRTMFLISQAMQAMAAQTLFVSASYVTDLLLAQWFGRHMYLGTQLPWQTADDDSDNIQIAGPTVTNSAVKLMQAMQFSRILLAGVDLCYSKDGLTHHRDSHEFRYGPVFEMTGQSVTTYAGLSAQTDVAFFSAISVLEAQVANQSTTQVCEYINLSEHAAQISGISHQKENQIILSELPESVAMQLASAWQLANQNTPAPLHHGKQTLASLKLAHKKFTQIQALAAEGLQHLPESDLLPPFAQKKLQKIEQKLQNDQNWLVTLKTYGYRSFTDLFRLIQQAEHLDVTTAHQGQKIYLTACHDVAQDLIKVISDAIVRVRVRIAEQENSTQHLATLLAQWQQDEHYARAAQWQKIWHPECAKQISQVTQQQFADLLRQQQIQAEQPVVLNKKQIQFDIAYLHRLHARAELLWQQQSGNQLQALLNHLMQQIERADDSLKEAGMSLANLIGGYQAELSNDTAGAKKYYFDAAQGWLAEIALNQLTVLLIRLNDLANVKLAFDCLCQLSPHYLPEYAKWCELIGEHAQAAKLYQQ